MVLTRPIDSNCYLLFAICAVTVIGLTGGIATGKSTVAAVLQRLGARIIDADALAREIVEPGQEAWQEIVEAFGRDILRPDQSIDRGKIRRKVFENQQV